MRAHDFSIDRWGTHLCEDRAPGKSHVPERFVAAGALDFGERLRFFGPAVGVDIATNRNSEAESEPAQGMCVRVETHPWERRRLAGIGHVPALRPSAPGSAGVPVGIFFRSAPTGGFRPRLE